MTTEQMDMTETQFTDEEVNPFQLDLRGHKPKATTRELLRELAWMVNAYYASLDEDGPFPTVDAVLQSCEKLLVTAFIQGSKPKPSAPRERQASAKPAAQPRQAQNGNRPRQGGSSRGPSKPRNVAANCFCGADCWRDFSESYTGCDCDPNEARNVYNGEDQGPCRCIMPRPLAGGKIEMQRDPNRENGWRWVEVTS